jgi:hypothetical protein
MPTDTKTDRRRLKADRKAAKAALSHAKTAEKEAKRLAKELPKGAAQRRIDQLLHEADTVRRAAKAERKHAPRRAARRAERVTVLLERTSMRLVPGGEDVRVKRPKRSKAEVDAAAKAKQRTKLLKKRRKQAAQMQKWAKGIAAHTVVQSITTPTDAEKVEKDLKRVRRARREDARATRTAG